MAGYFMCSKIEEMVTIAMPGVFNPPIRLKKKRHLTPSDSMKRCNKGTALLCTSVENIWLRSEPCLVMLGVSWWPTN